jgi:hypothetical protein
VWLLLWLSEVADAKAAVLGFLVSVPVYVAMVDPLASVVRAYPLETRVDMSSMLLLWSLLLWSLLLRSMLLRSSVLLRSMLLRSSELWDIMLSVLARVSIDMLLSLVMLVSMSVVDCASKAGEKKCFELHDVWCWVESVACADRDVMIEAVRIQA